MRSRKVVYTNQVHSVPVTDAERWGHGRVTGSVGVVSL